MTPIQLTPHMCAAAMVEFPNEHVNGLAPHTYPMTQSSPSSASRLCTGKMTPEKYHKINATLI
jgi:hypothetical protein